MEIEPVEAGPPHWRHPTLLTQTGHTTSPDQLTTTTTTTGDLYRHATAHSITPPSINTTS